MKVHKYYCDSCGGEHSPTSDMIYGYTMRKMHLHNELRYTDWNRSIIFTPKEATQRHICLDCLNAFKREKHPGALDSEKPYSAFIDKKPLTKEEMNKITEEWKRRYKWAG